MSRSCALLAALALAALVAGRASAATWSVVDQPDLKQQLDAAKPLEVEQLAAPAKSVMSWGTWTVLNPDGKTWDILQWYIKEYRQKTRVYITDLATGKTKLQTFPQTEGKSRVESLSTALGLDGKLYGATPDWDKWSSGGGVDMYVYDPAANELQYLMDIPGVGGEANPFALGHDGKFYGAGTFLAKDNPDNDRKAALYRFDPATKEVRNYGPIGPSHAPNSCYGYWMGIDDEYAYIASGKLPWWLVAVNLQTGEQKVLLEAPPGDYPYRMRIWRSWPGARAWVCQSDRDDRKEYEDGQCYWLWHGEAIPMPAGTDPLNIGNVKPPWPDTPSPYANQPKAPETYTGQLNPDADGNAYLWYRLQEDVAKGDVKPGEKPEEKGWHRIQLTNVETYPLKVHRLVALPDGKLFGTAQGYQGRFVYDPKTNEGKLLGWGGCSTYCYAVIGDKLYWSGYSSAPIEVLDWRQPWTVNTGGPPGEAPPAIDSDGSNPRRVGGTGVFIATRVKKMQSAAVGADGRFYVGGLGQRDYDGGGFGWYDPKTGSLPQDAPTTERGQSPADAQGSARAQAKGTGGMWRPFSAYRVYWLEPAMNGRYIVASTKTAPDELNNFIRPSSAKVFVFDVTTREIVREIIPVEKAPMAGPLVEVAPGRVLGITDDPASKGNSILYGLDLMTGEMLFQKKVPDRPAFVWGQGTEQYDFGRGPDGKVYTYLGNVLVRIDPKDARVEVIGRVPREAHFAFVGNDLYLCGEEHIRCIRDVVHK